MLRRTRTKEHCSSCIYQGRRALSDRSEFLPKTGVTSVAHMTVCRCWTCLVLLLSVTICTSAAPTTVALCFFGLTRSLHLTVDSIRHSIIDPLLLNDVKITIYLHTYNSTSVTNRRSAENAATADWTAYRLLQPHQWQVDDASAVDQELFDPYMKLWLKHGDAWAGETAEHTTLRNFIKQLYSLKQVTNMWVNDSSHFDLVLYLRSDLWFFNQLDVKELGKAAQHPRRIYTPSFHKWEGLNDRLAFGTPDVMTIYGNRLDVAINFAQQKALHAEHFLLDVATKAGLDVTGQSTLLFERVRATGELWGVPSSIAAPTDESMIRLRPGLKVQRDQLGKIVFVPL